MDRYPRINWRRGLRISREHRQKKRMDKIKQEYFMHKLEIMQQTSERTGKLLEELGKIAVEDMRQRQESKPSLPLQTLQYIKDSMDKYFFGKS